MSYSPGHDDNAHRDPGRNHGRVHPAITRSSAPPANRAARSGKPPVADRRPGGRLLPRPQPGRP
jgi:hypothetical protein